MVFVAKPVGPENFAKADDSGNTDVAKNFSNCPVLRSWIIQKVGQCENV